MLDTTHDILAKQREIIFQKTITERFLIGAEAIDFGRVIVESSIRNLQPDISELDLKIATFRRYYSSIFPDDELERIVQSMFMYYSNK
jgi:hypothetical protein